MQSLTPSSNSHVYGQVPIGWSVRDAEALEHHGCIALKRDVPNPYHMTRIECVSAASLPSFLIPRWPQNGIRDRRRQKLVLGLGREACIGAAEAPGKAVDLGDVYMQRAQEVVQREPCHGH